MGNAERRMPTDLQWSRPARSGGRRPCPDRAWALGCSYPQRPATCQWTQHQSLVLGPGSIINTHPRQSTTRVSLVICVAP